MIAARHDAEGKAAHKAAAVQQEIRSGSKVTAGHPFVAAVAEGTVLNGHGRLQRVDRSREPASKAAPRCGAATPMTTAMSPISQSPARCTAATARTSYAVATRSQTAAIRSRARRVGLVVQPVDAATVVVIARPADEEHLAPQSDRRWRSAPRPPERRRADLRESRRRAGGRAAPSDLVPHGARGLLVGDGNASPHPRGCLGWQSHSQGK